MSLFDEYFAPGVDQMMHQFAAEVTYTPPGNGATSVPGIAAIVGEETMTDRLSKDGYRFVTEREFTLDVNPDSTHFCGYLDPNQAHIQANEDVLLPLGTLTYQSVVYRITNIRAGQVGGLLAVMTERTEASLKSSDSYKPRRSNDAR